MKLHLPKLLLTAVMATLVAPSSWATITTVAPTDGQKNGTYTVTGVGSSSDKNIMSIPTGDDYTIYFQLDNITSAIGEANKHTYFNVNSSTSSTAAGAVQIGTSTTGNADDTNGLVITNGNSNNTQEFSGAVTGTGLIKKLGAGSDGRIVFSGDATGYLGNMYLGGTALHEGALYRFTLTFGGAVDAVTAAATTTSKGVAGTGNIQFTYNDNHLVFNYADSDSTVYITNEITNADGVTTSDVTLKGGADYVFQKTVKAGTVNLEAGTLTLKNCSNSGAANVQSNIVVSGGAVLKATNNDQLGWDTGSTKRVTLLGDSETSLATFELGGRQTLTTELYMGGNAKITGVGDGTNDAAPGLNAYRQNGAIINVSGVNNEYQAGLFTRDSFHITVEQGGTLKVSGQVRNASDGAKGYAANANPEGYEVGSVVKLGEGSVSYTYTANGTWNNFTKRYYNMAGDTRIQSKADFQHGIKVAGGTMYLESDILLGGSIYVTGGTLNMGTDRNITITSLTGFDHVQKVDETSLANDANGFAQLQDVYTIVSVGENGSVTGTATYKLGENTITLNSNGEYAQTSSGTSSLYVVNKGEVTTGTSLGAPVTQFWVQSHSGQTAGKLVIQGDYVNGDGSEGSVPNLTAAQILAETKGNGTIVVDTNVTLANGTSTVSNGTLVINDGKTLQVGTGGANQAGSSIASFTAVELAGGALNFNTASTSVSSLTVSAESDMVVKYGGNNQPTVTLTGTTELRANLSVTNDDSGKLLIQKLKGTGNLSVDGSGWGHTLRLEVLSFENYTGSISYDGNGIDEAGDHLVLGETWGGNLTVTNYADTNNQQRQLGFIQKITAGGQLTLSNVNGWMLDGTVAANVVLQNEGLRLTNGGSLQDNQVGTQANYTFTGSVSGNGNYEVNVGGPNNISTAFTNDISGWKAEQDGSNHMLFSTAAEGTQKTYYLFLKENANVVNVSEIKTENGATLNMLTNHTTAATVNSDIINDGKALNLQVTNTAADGTTFNGAVKATQVTVSEGTVAKFTNADVQIGNVAVSTGAKLAFTAADVQGETTPTVNTLSVAANAQLELSTKLTASSLTIEDGGYLVFGNGSKLTVTGTLTLDASAITFADDISFSSADAVTLATAGTLNVTGVDSWKGEYTIGDKAYTAGLSAVDNVLSLTFEEVVTPENPSITTTLPTSVTDVLGYEKGMLTLQVEGLLTENTMAVVDILGDPSTDALMAEVLRLVGDTKTVAITLEGTEGGKLVADAFNKVVFVNEKGEGYYGESVMVDGHVMYNVDRIPEPASATLSLAALMMLCARRRRRA